MCQSLLRRRHPHVHLLPRLLLSSCFARSSSPLPRPQFLPFPSGGSVNLGRPSRCDSPHHRPPREGETGGRGRQTSRVMMKKWQVGGGSVRPPIKPVGVGCRGPPGAARPATVLFQKERVKHTFKRTDMAITMNLNFARAGLATSLGRVLAGGCRFGSPPASSQQLQQLRDLYSSSATTAAAAAADPGEKKFGLNFLVALYQLHSLVVLRSHCGDVVVSVHLLNRLQGRLVTIL